MAERAKRKTVRRKQPAVPKELANLSKEEIFARLNASAERTLEALMKAYEAGTKEGFEGKEEDRVMELLKRAKALRDKVGHITQENAG